MRNKKLKIISGTIAFIILIPILYHIIFKDGRQGYIEELLKGVEEEKTMTAYNKAYLTIKNLDDDYIKEDSLERLEDYKDMCTTEEVESIMKDIIELEETGYVEIYNDLLFSRFQKLKEPRNEYYYRYEITNRSDKLFTKDYMRAQDRINEATENLNLSNIQYAKQNTAYVKNEKNKEYMENILMSLEKSYEKTLKIYDTNLVSDNELKIRLEEPLNLEELNKDDFNIDNADINEIKLSDDKNEIIIDFKINDEKKYDKEKSIILKIDSIDLKDRTTMESQHLIYNSED